LNSASVQNQFGSGELETEAGSPNIIRATDSQVSPERLRSITISDLGPRTPSFNRLNVDSSKIEEALNTQIENHPGNTLHVRENSPNPYSVRTRSMLRSVDFEGLKLQPEI